VGKWGRNFVEYGLTAAGDALDDAGVAWPDTQYLSGADTIRNGYPGFVAGATFAQALGWTGARVPSSYAACASGAQAISNARAQILAGLCDVALVVGADATPKGFFAPVGGDRQDNPDWLQSHLLGATNPTYFALYARRRMELYGATEGDFAAVSTITPRFPQTVIEMPNFSTDSAVTTAATEPTFKQSVALAAYEEAGIGPEEVDLTEVYDLSSAFELDWYEDIGLCKKGEAEHLLRHSDTTVGGRIPVNPSGGLSCFGKAIPAQSIAQVCELVWQLRGQATGRQVEGAKVGITANQGLFGHGSSVIVAR
jgi:acetyl-CoA acetyltransferase